MLNKKTEKTLNDQLNFEMHSANIYLSMAAYFDAMNFSGFAHWMKMQAQEETGHATRFYNFINERGGRVILTGLDAPPTEWDSPLAAFEHALEHERLVSGRINGMVTSAMADKDHAVVNFLQWFVAEQVEEEASVETVVQQLKLLASAPGGLFMLDRQLAGRTSA